MKRITILVLTLATVALLGACGSSGGSKATGDKGATATDATSSDGGGSKAAGGCGSMDGQTGVVRSFCDGPAKMSFTIGDTTGEIGGGTCETSGGFFVLNAGTVVSTEFTGAKPDYAGFGLPTKEGDFSGAVVTITYGGTAHVISDASGTRTASSGTFSGTDLDTKTTVTGSWTC